jgi:hypothetical protein
MKERDHFEDLAVDGRIKLKQNLQKLDGMWWTGFIWFTLETSDGLL